MSRQGSIAYMSAYAMFMVLMGCFILPALAIRCHQCNSHLDEDCHNLRLSVPAGARDDQYLSECQVKNSKAFCRKTAILIQGTGEKRVVRSCGWIEEGFQELNFSCITADNEGFLQQICVCYTDGCNSAPSSGQFKFGLTAMAGLMVMFLRAIRFG